MGVPDPRSHTTSYSPATISFCPWGTEEDDATPLHDPQGTPLTTSLGFVICQLHSMATVSALVSLQDFPQHPSLAVELLDSGDCSWAVHQEPGPALHMFLPLDLHHAWSIVEEEEGEEGRQEASCLFGSAGCPPACSRELWAQGWGVEGRVGPTLTSLVRRSRAIVCGIERQGMTRSDGQAGGHPQPFPGHR